jgi:1,4-alpha-glucan branching enzyme
MTPDSAGNAAGFLTAEEIHLFNEGRYFRLYEKLGAQPHPGGGIHFAVWAPNAERVSVFGSFSGWNRERHPLSPLGSSGIWAGVVKEARAGDLYKYHIIPRFGGAAKEKADPLAFCTETPPHTASVIRPLSYEWNDADWLAARSARQAADKPLSIYEVHLGSWRHKVEDYNRPLSYRELADELVPYVKDMGFTHIELMPVMEHPFGGSWGYQTTGYFAPSRRYGDPEELMEFIDRCHQADIGVILDWAPSHFPDDPHGLAQFDGTHLYEHADPRQGFHPDWHSLIYNYGRNEVRSFLISSALFWLDRYHADGLRVDAVASMIYLDYSRREGEWIPNAHGGRENLEALHFLKELNTAIHQGFPGALVIAEESTSFPKVSRPVEAGGLGFDMKWDMGWMHDALRFFGRDPLYRSHHQNDITFRSLYAFNENFVLALSHDEVVYGKKSLLSKMGGDDWQRFASLRCLFTSLFATPGRKLLFMGGEIAQVAEWNHNQSLDWHLLGDPRHAGIQHLVRGLNALYRAEPALHRDFEPGGMEWIDGTDSANSVLSFLRRGGDESQVVLCAFNFSGVPRPDYRIGVPSGGLWTEIFNSDAAAYGGSGCHVAGDVSAEPVPFHGRPFSIRLTLPPNSGVLLKWKT